MTLILHYFHTFLFHLLEIIYIDIKLIYHLKNIDPDDNSIYGYIGLINFTFINYTLYIIADDYIKCRKLKKKCIKCKTVKLIILHLISSYFLHLSKNTKNMKNMKIMIKISKIN